MDNEMKDIEKILEKYNTEEKEKSVHDKVIELDKKVEAPGKILSLTVGILGTLFFGTGMSLIMAFDKMFIGIVISIIGLIILSPAYTIYKKITKKRREKYASEIISLAESK